MYKGTIPQLNKDFRFPTKWEEITIGKWAEYQRLVKELQKNFVKKFNLKDESEIGQITTIEIFTQYPEYFVKLFSFWTGINNQDAFKVDKADILAIYETMNNLLAKNTSEKRIDRFVFGEVTYLFPRSEYDIKGNEARMAKESFGAMIYAFQQDKILEDLSKSRFDVVADQMAILCRPEGEEYDPVKVSERARKFKDLTMDIVWEFVFFSIRQTPRFKQLTRIYSQQAEAEAIKS